MHDKIFKYELHIVSRQQITIPAGSNILAVQPHKDKICLWALVDTTAKHEIRIIEVTETGQSFRPLHPDQSRRHLDTVQQDGMVWHIFEIVNK